ADFVGSANFLEATVSAPTGRPDSYHVQTALGLLECHAVERLREGDKVVISVRPEDVHASAERFEGANALEGTVDAKVFLGECLEFKFKVDDPMLLARVHPSFSPTVGTRVYLRIDPEKRIAITEQAQEKTH